MRKLIFCFLLFSSHGFSQNTITEKYVYPDSIWQVVADPAADGWSAAKLSELKQFIIDSTYSTGMLVIRHGKVLLQYGDVAETSYVASCRKSILCMLYGPFVASGKVRLNETIEQLSLDDIGGLLPVEKKATVKDLLTARSGVYHAASNPGDASSMAPKRGSVEPGKFWLYNNWDFNIAGYILEKETGKSVYDLLDSLLAKPLQMQDWKKEAQRKSGDTTKSKYLAYHMWLSTRDMARLGYLMLRNGSWKGKQIIPGDWVKITTSVVTSHQEAVDNKTAVNHFAYGYLWWIWDKPYSNGAYEGAYTAIGAYGQFITVIPKLDIVVAFKTKSTYERATSPERFLQVLDKLIACRENRE